MQSGIWDYYFMIYQSIHLVNYINNITYIIGTISKNIMNYNYILYLIKCIGICITNLINICICICI